MSEELWRLSAVEAVALRQAALLYEQRLGLDRLLPIDPRPGGVPPAS